MVSLMASSSLVSYHTFVHDLDQVLTPLLPAVIFYYSSSSTKIPYWHIHPVCNGFQSLP